MRNRKFRGWNGKHMEYGGFSVHSTSGKVIPLLGLSGMKHDSPVMEYIGLPDKENNDIYEDDFVICPHGSIYLVSYQIDYGCGFYPFAFANDESQIYNWECSVVGNKWQNLEYIKECNKW